MSASPTSARAGLPERAHEIGNGHPGVTGGSLPAETFDHLLGRLAA